MAKKKISKKSEKSEGRLTIPDVPFATDENLNSLFNTLTNEFLNRVSTTNMPFIYGINIKLDKNGIPTVEQFGNVKIFSSGPVRNEEREPMIEVIDDPKKIVVIAEMPGVEKDDIDIKATPYTIRIAATAKEKPGYYKRISLTAPVDPMSAVARYTNGVLELTMKKSGLAKSEYVVGVK